MIGTYRLRTPNTPSRLYSLRPPTVASVLLGCSAITHPPRFLQKQHFLVCSCFSSTLPLRRLAFYVAEPASFGSEEINNCDFWTACKYWLANPRIPEVGLCGCIRSVAQSFFTFNSLRLFILRHILKQRNLLFLTRR